jgi:uncharacterized protein (DUF362 family)
MQRRIDRRTFIKQSSLIGASTLAAGSLIPSLMPRMAWGLPKDSDVDLSVVRGANNYDSTIHAVDLLGGMKRFVPRGSKVGLLVNSKFDKRGTYVKPEIALAVIAMCHEAGAKEIVSLDDASGSYWDKASKTEYLEDLVESLREPEHIEVTVDGGVALKEADIARELLECDVFINVPVVKHHEGTRFTCTLKNLMGATTSSTNRFFHMGSGVGSGYYGDVDFLSQCIADVALLKKPDLCIVDATEFITTNGPYGPGKISRPQKVLASSDGVALDSYCARFVGLTGEAILMVRKAHEHGLGEIDVGQLAVKEVQI